jgi:hypothetical protein
VNGKRKHLIYRKAAEEARALNPLFSDDSALLPPPDFTDSYWEDLNNYILKRFSFHSVSFLGDFPVFSFTRLNNEEPYTQHIESRYITARGINNAKLSFNIDPYLGIKMIQVIPRDARRLVREVLDLDKSHPHYARRVYARKYGVNLLSLHEKATALYGLSISELFCYDSADSSNPLLNILFPKKELHTEFCNEYAYYNKKEQTEKLATALSRLKFNNSVVRLTMNKMFDLKLSFTISTLSPLLALPSNIVLDIHRINDQIQVSIQGYRQLAVLFNYMLNNIENLPPDIESVCKRVITRDRKTTKLIKSDKFRDLQDQQKFPAIIDDALCGTDTEFGRDWKESFQFETFSIFKARRLARLIKIISAEQMKGIFEQRLNTNNRLFSYPKKALQRNGVYRSDLAALKILFPDVVFKDRFNVTPNTKNSSREQIKFFICVPDKDDIDTYRDSYKETLKQYDILLGYLQFAVSKDPSDADVYRALVSLVDDKILQFKEAHESNYEKQKLLTSQLEKKQIENRILFPPTLSIRDKLTLLDNLRFDYVAGKLTAHFASSYNPSEHVRSLTRDATHFEVWPLKNLLSRVLIKNEPSADVLTHPRYSLCYDALHNPKKLKQRKKELNDAVPFSNEDLRNLILRSETDMVRPKFFCSSGNNFRQSVVLLLKNLTVEQLRRLRLTFIGDKAIKTLPGDLLGVNIKTSHLRLIFPWRSETMRDGEEKLSILTTYANIDEENLTRSDILRTLEELDIRWEKLKLNTSLTNSSVSS